MVKCVKVSTVSLNCWYITPVIKMVKAPISGILGYDEQVNHTAKVAV